MDVHPTSATLVGLWATLQKLCNQPALCSYFGGHQENSSKDSLSSSRDQMFFLPKLNSNLRLILERTTHKPDLSFEGERVELSCTSG